MCAPGERAFLLRNGLRTGWAQDAAGGRGARKRDGAAVARVVVGAGDGEAAGVTTGSRGGVATRRPDGVRNLDGIACGGGPGTGRAGALRSGRGRVASVDGTGVAVPEGSDAASYDGYEGGSSSWKSRRSATSPRRLSWRRRISRIPRPTWRATSGILFGPK